MKSFIFDVVNVWLKRRNLLMGYNAIMELVLPLDEFILLLLNPVFFR